MIWFAFGLAGAAFAVAAQQIEKCKELEKRIIKLEEKIQ